jgi:signal peptidase
MHGWRLLSMLCIGLVLVMLACLSLWFISGGRIYSVATDSMRPIFAAGDAVLVRPVSFEQLRPGDIVSFRDRDQPSLVTTHRIITIDSQRARITTKGDNVAQADLPVSFAQVLGRAEYVAPHLGKLLQWLRTPVGLVIAIYIPAVTILIFELRRLLYRASVTRYRLRQ